MKLCNDFGLLWRTTVKRSKDKSSLLKKHNRDGQSGSIMLEVVAVLALMGVMGAMLFRQIYQRNQELHNIQMASEIRTVKEALAAYIQANRGALLISCPTPGVSNGCEENDVCPCDVTSDDYEGVLEYLPDGWFADIVALSGAYSLSIWNYQQADAAKRRVIYGVVAPTIGTIPATGWNFKRAARVALLVGADGGAYNPDITGNTVNGALGSWNLDKDGIITNDVCEEDNDSCSVYVATTGIDVFVPETEGSEGSVNIPDPWSLSLAGLHAYQYFSAGNKSTGVNCHEMNHSSTTKIGGKDWVQSDTINYGLNGNCQPLFWVGSDQNTSGGNVYVATDLHIGDIESGRHNEALTLTSTGEIHQKGGVTIASGGLIQQEDGLTIDKDGRIIAKDTVAENIGDLKKGEHFVVDPAYTSTMNDIRLTSRGGVRLSDILPSWILKYQEAGSCIIKKDNKSCTLTGYYGLVIPECPADYHWTVVIIPTKVGRYSFNLTGSTGSSTSTTGPAIDGDSSHTHSVEGHTHTLGADNLDRDPLSVYVNIGATSIKNGNTAFPYNSTYTSGRDITVKFQYTNNVPEDETVSAFLQTYCVWLPAYLNTKATCEAAGYKYEKGACTATHIMDENRSDGIVNGAERNQSVCEAAGFTWEGGRCKYIYKAANQINDSSICVAAGYTWNRCTPSTGCCYSGSTPCTCTGL